MKPKVLMNFSAFISPILLTLPSFAMDVGEVILGRSSNPSNVKTSAGSATSSSGSTSSISAANANINMCNKIALRWGYIPHYLANTSNDVFPSPTVSKVDKIWFNADESITSTLSCFNLITSSTVCNSYSAQYSYAPNIYSTGNASGGFNGPYVGYYLYGMGCQNLLNFDISCNSLAQQYDYIPSITDVSTLPSHTQKYMTDLNCDAKISKETTCNLLAKTYGIVPGVSWGSADGNKQVQDLYLSGNNPNDCNKFVLANKCNSIAKAYNIRPNQSFGTTPGTVNDITTAKGFYYFAHDDAGNYCDYYFLKTTN